MSTLSITLPEELTRLVDHEAEVGGYASAGEYITALISDTLLSRQRDIEQLREKVMDGARSGPGKPIDKDWFTELRRQANR